MGEVQFFITFLCSDINSKKRFNSQTVLGCFKYRLGCRQKSGSDTWDLIALAEPMFKFEWLV
jgi:hypothetical protein